MRRPARTAAALTALALLAPTAGTRAQGSGGRYWCFDYVLEHVTGEISSPGHSAEDLRQAMIRRGYVRRDFPSLFAPGSDGARGDVLLIADAHAAIYVAPGLVNHFFGDSVADVMERTWSIAELRSFGRTKDPAYGLPVPREQPYLNATVQIWKRPAQGTPEPPQPVAAGRRCASVNQSTGLQCRYLPGHDGPHLDWSATEWTDASSGRPSAAPRTEIGLAGGPMTADEASARINELLENVRRLADARRWAEAVDALAEATRLAGGRPERGEPGGPHSERVLRAAGDLRARLLREGDELAGQIESLNRALNKSRYEAMLIRLTVDSFRPDFDETTRPEDLSLWVDAAATALQQEPPLMAAGSSDAHQLAVAIRAAADAVCSGTDAVQAEQAWDQTGRDRQTLEDGAMAAASWWARRRASYGFEARVERLQATRLRIETIQQGLGKDDAEFAAKLAEARAAVVAMSNEFRSTLGKMTVTKDELQTLAAEYERSRGLGPFGEERPEAWRRVSTEIPSSLDDEIEDIDRLGKAIDQLAARGRFDRTEKMRQVLADAESRLDAVEREAAARDKQASAILTADEAVQRATRQAEACLKALQPMPATPTPAQPQQPARTTQPAQPAGGAAGGRPQPPAPVAPVTTAPQQSVTPPAHLPHQPSANVPMPQPTVEPDTAGGIRIQSATTRIMVGQRVQFIATDYGNRPYTTDVVWTSLRDDLLSIDGQGWATGLQPGTLSIVARYGDDMPAAIEVEVVDAPQGGFRYVGSTTAPAGTAAAQGQPAPPSAAAGGTAGAPAQGSGGFRVVGSGTRAADLAGDAQDGGARPSAAEAALPEDAPASAAAAQPGWDEPQGAGRGQASEGQGAAGGPGGSAGAAGPGQAGQPASQAPIAAGSPAAWHIFATGSRLGWAGGLARYSVGAADQSIIQHLQVAAEHAMWANRESRPPRLAWPGWAGMGESFRSWADSLQRTPSNDVRRQIAVSTSGNISGYAQALSFQTVGTTESRANCEAIYVQLGFQLAYGAQVMQIADEAVRNGDPSASRERRADAISHLNTALSLLNEYDQLVPASGFCADLGDVRELLQGLFALDVNDVGAQAAAATAAWELANERIAALAGALSGSQRAALAPETTPTAAAAQPHATATAPPSGGQTDLPPDLARFAEILDDPGELEGYWAGLPHLLRFTKQGDEYIGTFLKAPPSVLAYADGETVFRGTRAGPNLYRGTLQLHRRLRFNESGIALGPQPDGTTWLAYDPIEESRPAAIAVLGSYMHLRTQARPNDQAAPGSPEAGRSYCDVILSSMRVAGPPPLTTLDGGSQLDVRHLSIFDKWCSAQLQQCALTVAQGQSASGATMFIAFPDSDAWTQPEMAKVRFNSPQLFNTAGAALTRLLRRDPLSAAWVERRGFTVLPGRTNLPGAAFHVGLDFPSE